jgi:PAS domain-containing protein
MTDKTADATILAAENDALRRRVAELEAERMAQLAQQQAALATANRLNQDIIKSAHEGIIVYGPDLRYLIWNPCMERLSGRKADEVLGKHPLRSFHS